MQQQIQVDLGTTETLATLGTGLYNLVSSINLDHSNP